MAQLQPPTIYLPGYPEQIALPCKAQFHHGKRTALISVQPSWVTEAWTVEHTAKHVMTYNILLISFLCCIRNVQFLAERQQVQPPCSEILRQMYQDAMFWVHMPLVGLGRKFSDMYSMSCKIFTQLQQRVLLLVFFYKKSQSPGEVSRVMLKADVGSGNHYSAALI